MKDEGEERPSLALACFWGLSMFAVLLIADVFRGRNMQVTSIVSYSVISVLFSCLFYVFINSKVGQAPPDDDGEGHEQPSTDR